MIASRITKVISNQRGELIRDRIAEILIAEFAVQSTLQTDNVLKEVLEDVNIFPERFHPLNESEIFALNMFWFQGEYDNKNQRSVRGAHTYILDFVGNSSATNRGDGDQITALQVQRIAGIVRSILENSNWVRLGFDTDRIIERTLVRSIKRTEEEDTRDASNIILYRMIFQVWSEEVTTNEDIVPIDRNTTDVQIGETTNGLQYIYDATP